jgi:hypothetical protein
MANRNDLDSGQAGRRSHIHTQALMDAFSPRELWRGWGIIDGILVISLFLFEINLPLLYTAIYSIFSSSRHS